MYTVGFSMGKTAGKRVFNGFNFGLKVNLSIENLKTPKFFGYLTILTTNFWKILKNYVFCHRLLRFKHLVGLVGSKSTTKVSKEKDPLRIPKPKLVGGLKPFQKISKSTGMAFSNRGWRL